MKIEYSNHHRWFRENTSDPMTYFQGRNRKKILSSLDQLEKHGITHVIEPLTKEFFSWFTPLYTSHITVKKNAIVHDTYQKTLGKPVIEYPYFSLTLKENDVYKGGTIFSVREDRLAYAYRVYERTWDSAPIKANPALLAEYFVAEYASRTNLKYVSHGRDRNPYGLNSDIGLATFKLSVGCYPLLTENPEFDVIDTETLTGDALILKKPENGVRITEAYLVTAHDTEAKHIQVTKYPELLEVTRIYRD